MGNQLPPVELVPNATAENNIATGHAFCVTVGGRRLNCWGRNESGVLGQEQPNAVPTNYIGDQVNEMGSSVVTTKLE